MKATSKTNYFSHSGDQQRSPLLIWLDDAARRIMDVSLSLIGLIILSPLFLIVAIAIKRSSPGPVFYWGPRAGKNGKLFNILKFRTMYERPDSYSGPKVTAEDDPRITPLGHLLRQTKINELPQLWNVLIGEMSLVGPRPEDPTIAAEWPDAMRRLVLAVKPGITSPASVVYRNEENLLQSADFMETYLWDILPTKMRLDQLYVRNRSILMDFDVIFWTFIALLPRLKSVTVPEHLLYWGPLSRFTHYYLVWFFVDFIVSFIAVSAAGILRRLTTPLDLGWQMALMIALSIALLFSLINTLAGFNRINWARAGTQEALDLALSTSLVTIAVLVANFIIPRGARFPISIIVVAGILSYLGFIAVRYRSRLITGLARYWVRLRGPSMTPLGERVLIVGAGSVAHFAIWLLSNENLSQAFSIIGLVDDDPRKIGTRMDGLSVVNTTSAIPELVEKHDIGLILFAIADIQPEEQERILGICQSTLARIVPIPDILDNIRAQFPTNEIDSATRASKILENATLDRLTGAVNYQQFLRLGEVEYNRAQRYHRPIAILAFSIDYERPGQSLPTPAVLMQCIKAAAQRCQETIRGIDYLGRYKDHGIENILIVLLPETDATAAERVARRIEDCITASPVSTNQGQIHPRVQYHFSTSVDDNFGDINTMLLHTLEPLTMSQPAGTDTKIHRVTIK